MVKIRDSILLADIVKAFGIVLKYRKMKFCIFLNMNTANNLSKDIIKAHEYSSNNRASLKKDNLCGCFYCLKIFNPNEITEWTDWTDEDEESGETALCPYCDIDSVIGKSSGYPITEEFLGAMKKHWF